MICEHVSYLITTFGVIKCMIKTGVTGQGSSDAPLDANHPEIDSIPGISFR